MIKKLLKYVKINGFTHNEKVVLDEIENDIISLKLKYKRNNKYGISVFKGEGDKIILFDSHVDKVQKKNIKPIQKNKEIHATGLDNRIGVVVNLELCKTLKPKDDQKFIFIFSVREELDGSGLLKFIEKTPKIERKKWTKFYEIEVSYAKDKNGHFNKKTFSFGEDEYPLTDILDISKLPTIGKGICPINQEFANKEYQKTRIKYNTNTRQLVSKIPNIKFIYLAVPVVDMHYPRSKCDISDIFTLYEYIINDINTL